MFIFFIRNKSSSYLTFAAHQSYQHIDPFTLVISLCRLESDSIFSSQAIVSRGDKMESFSFTKVHEKHIRNPLYTVLFCIKICTL